MRTQTVKKKKFCRVFIVSTAYFRCSRQEFQIWIFCINKFEEAHPCSLHIKMTWKCDEIKYIWQSVIMTIEMFKLTMNMSCMSSWRLHSVFLTDFHWMKVASFVADFCYDVLCCLTKNRVVFLWEEQNNRISFIVE